MENENFSLKEMIQEVRDSQKRHDDLTIRIMTTLENIELQCKKLTVIVEEHEERIQKQEGFQGKVMLVWGVAVVVFTTVVNKVLASVSL